MLFLLAFVACSRTGDSNAPGTLHVARISAELPPQWPEEYPGHFVRLPAGGLAMTAGADPSSDHPSGTVYVIEPFRARTETIAEWDLAAGHALRWREMPFVEADGAWPRLLHRGDGVHVVALGRDGTYYMLLDTSFRMLASSRLGELNGSTATLAGDGALTIVLGRVPSYDGGGWMDAFAATFDAHGKRIAGRELGYGRDALGGNTVLGDVTAVAGGSPYILTSDGLALRLHQLTPDLAEVISTIVPIAPHASKDQATIWTRGDRLVVDVPPEQQFEYSLDLTEVRKVPRRPPRAPRALEDTLDDVILGKFVDCPQSVTMGSIYALLCVASRRDEPSVHFIAWDHEER